MLHFYSLIYLCRNVASTLRTALCWGHSCGKMCHINISYYLIEALEFGSKQGDSFHEAASGKFAGRDFGCPGDDKI